MDRSDRDPMIFLHKMFDLFPFGFVNFFLIVLHDFLNGEMEPPGHVKLESIVFGDSLDFGFKLGSGILSFEILLILDDKLDFHE